MQWLCLSPGWHCSFLLLDERACLSNFLQCRICVGLCGRLKENCDLPVQSDLGRDNRIFPKLLFTMAQLRLWYSLGWVRAAVALCCSYTGQSGSDPSLSQVNFNQGVKSRHNARGGRQWLEPMVPMCQLALWMRCAGCVGVQLYLAVLGWLLGALGALVLS